MSARDTDLFEDSAWQMALGERAAIEGLLCTLRPALAIEIGTAEGACLRRIAMHAAEVHSFDIVTPTIGGLGPHVHLHTGDSHLLLPQVLERFAAEGRNVDFVVVDGDHSSEGVRRDVEALLVSPAVVDTVIIAHDTGNERVRAGLDAVPYNAYPKVAHVDLDFVPGHLGRDRFPGELWYGLGLIVVVADRPAYGSGPAVQSDRHHGGEVLSIARDVLAGWEVRGGPEGYDARARQLSEAYAFVDTLGQRIADLEAAHASRAAELTAEIERERSVAEALRTPGDWRRSTPLQGVLRVARRIRRS